MSVYVYIYVYHTRKTGKEVERKEEGRFHYMVVKKKSRLVAGGLKYANTFLMGNVLFLQ